MQLIDGIPVWGDPLENAVKQMKNCKDEAEYCALMADHHLGYAVPIGGVIAYRGKVSPSGVGYDIACGNKAVLTDMMGDDLRQDIKTIMDDIFAVLDFGVGRKNKTEVDHELFDDDPAWDIETVFDLKTLARQQLGTIGSGNHYVDLFTDELHRVWIGVHFGSRGFGHKIATHYVKAGGGSQGMNVKPVLFDVESQLGKEYVAAMKLAGRYAYAGRDWVCSRVAELLGANVYGEVHNHHNFAWLEDHHHTPLWVVRKGATPAFPGQMGFVGGSMGDNSVILQGIESAESKDTLYSTVHGAGRVMSRNEAAGKTKWKSGKKVRVSQGVVSRDMMNDWIGKAGVELRGAGTDESPHCYKRLDQVLKAHSNTIKILHTLKPVGVAMAPAGEFDPFKD